MISTTTQKLFPIESAFFLLFNNRILQVIRAGSFSVETRSHSLRCLWLLYFLFRADGLFLSKCFLRCAIQPVRAPVVAPIHPSKHAFLPVVQKKRIAARVNRNFSFVITKFMYTADNFRTSIRKFEWSRPLLSRASVIFNVSSRFVVDSSS